MLLLIDRVLLALGILSLMSCASSESYYLLSPQAKTSDTDPPTSDFSLGLGPVLIPDYIDRSEIVFQSSPNKFEIPEGHLWAGSLKKTITSVLATNLSNILNTTHIRTYPWEPGAKLRYSVAIDFQHFHAQTGGDAVLQATWRLYDEEEQRIVSQRQSTLERPLLADGYEAVVAAESLLLNDLADEIVTAVRLVR